MVCDYKTIVFLFNFLKVAVLLFWGNCKCQIKTSINCYFGPEIFTLPLQWSNWGSYANLTITCVSETMLVKREQKYHNIFLKNVRQSLLHLKCSKWIYEVCTRDAMWEEGNTTKWKFLIETTANGTSAELTPKRSQGQLEGKEKGMKLKLNDDCWKRTRSVEGEKKMKLNWNEHCWKGTRTVGNQGKYSEVCKPRPHAADIQPFAVTEFQVGRKQYQKCKGSSWTKGQRPVNWNTRIWTTSVTWRWGWNETLLLMAPALASERSMIASCCFVRRQFWRHRSGSGGLFHSCAEEEGWCQGFEIAACSTSR